MFLHDGVRDRQAETGTLANFFRREERVEDLRLQFVRDARAIVVDLEDHRLLSRIVPCANDQNAAAICRQHRLLRIDDEIQENLLDLIAVGKHLRQPGREGINHSDVRNPLFVCPQGEGFTDDLIEIDHRARRLTLAREREQIADDARGTFRFAEDRFEAAPNWFVERGALRQSLCPAEDGRQRIVQLVRDAGDGLAERGHLLCLQQLVINVPRLVVEFLALADVADERFHSERSVAGRHVRGGGQLHPDRALIRAPEAKQIVGDRAVLGEPIEEGDTRLRIDETIAVEGAHVGFGRFAGIAEHQLQMRVGGDGLGRFRTERPDVHAFVDRLKETCKRLGALIHPGIIERREIWSSGHLVIWSLIDRLNDPIAQSMTR